MDAEHMDHSPTIGALAKALAASQAKLEDAKKDSINPHFKNRYATLSSVRATITPVLSAHGLAVVQTNEPHGAEGACVVTTLMHESGEWIRGRLFVPVTKRDPQGFGSAITYARRYALAAIVGIASDEDDDAETASRPTSPGPSKAADRADKSKPEAKPETKPDVDALVKTIADAKDAADLSKAALAVGRVRAQLSKADVARCKTAHDAKMRELEGQAA